MGKTLQIAFFLILAGVVGWTYMSKNAHKLDAAAGGDHGATIELRSQDQWADLTKPGNVVMVDFYADWCGPCKLVKPTIHQVADEYEGRVTVVAVNVDNFGELAGQYNVRYIPHVIVIKDGKQVEKIENLSHEGIVASLDRFAPTAAAKPPVAAPATPDATTEPEPAKDPNIIEDSGV